MPRPADIEVSGGLYDYYHCVASNESAAADLRGAADLYTRADVEFRHERVEEGLKLAEEALELFKSLDHRDGAADSVRLVVLGQCLKHDHEEADRRAAEALKAAREAGDINVEAKLLLAVAEANCHRSGDEERKTARKFATQARSIFREQGDPRMEATALLALLSLLDNEGDMSKKANQAQQMAGDAINLFQEVNDTRGVAMAIHWQGVALAASNQLEEALGCADDARYLFQQCGDPILEARELQIKADWCLLGGAVQLALPAAEEALALFRESSCFSTRKTNALRTVVQCHSANKSAQNGIALAEEAAELARQAGDQRAEADALLLASQAYVDLAMESCSGDDPDKWEPSVEAVQKAEEALEILRDLGDEENEARAATVISALQLRRQDFEKASYSAQEALWMFEDVEDPECHAAALQALISSHVSKNEYKEAVQLGYEQRDVFKKANDPGNEAQALLNIADLLFEQKKIDEAVAAAREAQSVFHQAQDRKGEGQAMRYIAELREANNEPQRALFAAERARGHLRSCGDYEGEAQMLYLAVQKRVAALQKRDEDDSELLPPWEEVAKVTRDGKDLVAVCQKIGDKQLEGSALCLLARVYAYNGKQQDALDVADEAVSLFVVAEDALNEAMARVLCARLYLAEQNLKKALEEAKEARCLFEENGDEAGVEYAEEVLDSLREFEFRVDDGGGGAPSRPAAKAPRSGADAAADSETALQPASAVVRDTSLVMGSLQQVARKMLGSDEDIHADLPLFDVGINSMNAVLFRNKLLDEFQGVDLPVTLVFDFPTLKSMAELVTEQN
mmetsp:Transcript_112654/g.291015  ORF Transcript_112654/g.291015 Transcript_112654/m.291015 type:complete len:801 (-) Transcript_112654:174-2576(-)